MRNFGFWKRFVLVIFAAGFVSGCVKLNDDLGQMFKYKNPTIEARKKVMQTNNALFKRITITAQAGSGIGPMRQIQWAAEDLAKNARKIRGAFKTQTLGGVTRGTSKIWSNRSGFTQNAANLVASAELLALAASTGSMSAVKNSIKTVGGNCVKCHKGFRAK